MCSVIFSLRMTISHKLLDPGILHLPVSMLYANVLTLHVSCPLLGRLVPLLDVCSSTHEACVQTSPLSTLLTSKVLSTIDCSFLPYHLYSLCHSCVTQHTCGCDWLSARMATSSVHLLCWDQDLAHNRHLMITYELNEHKNVCGYTVISPCLRFCFSWV